MNNINPRFFDVNERLNKKCPQCGSEKISYLMRGIFIDENEEHLLESGEIMVMGCLFSEPYNLGCRNCGYFWASVPMFLENNL